MARSNTANSGHSYFDLSIQVVASDATAYTLRAVVYLTSLNVVDSSNSLAVGGNWARSGTLALNGAYSAVQVWYQDIVVNRVYGADVGVSVSASWSAVEYWGVTLSASEGYTVPARAYELPAAPSGASVARNSDTSQTVTWTNNPTGPAPYQALAVQRWDNVGAVWVTTATLSGSATSYTDTTTVADRQYQYRVMAGNTSGWSGFSTTAAIYTTPSAPGTPTAAKSGSNIALAFTNTATVDEGIKVYASQNGAAFALLATVATADLTSWTHVAPSSVVTWAYKVATYRGALISAQSAASNTVQLLAPPNAPTGLGPSTVRDATEAVTLTWTHNPVDSTAQTAFQVRHRALGSGTWTTVSPVTSGTSAWVLAGGTYANPVTVEWQVATKGQHASYSPFSATATLPASARPTATIATPADGGTVATSALTVTWGYYDAESTAQAAWEVELLAGGALVEARSGVGVATSAALATVLPNGSSRTVRVRVQDGAGLWSVWDSNAFTVTYALPPVPTLVATWDPETATIALQITNPGPAGAEVATHHVQVYRSLDDGPWTLIATGVPPNTTVTDWSPTVAGSNAYRVDAVSALPSVTSSAVATVTTPLATDPSPSLWLSGGPGFSQVCRGRSNIAIAASAGVAEKVLRRYAGRTRPVERAGVGTSRAWAVSVDVIAFTVGASAASAWEGLALLAGPHLLRTPDLYVRGSLSMVGDQRSPGGAITTVSFTFTETDDD